MNLKPVGRKIVIRPDKPKEKSDGGIVLPDNQRHGQVLGAEVLAVGPGHYQEGKLIAICQNGDAGRLRAGNRIIFMRAGGWEIEHQGEKLKVIDETDVLVVVEGKP